jgi:hypothetical protein
VTVRKLSLILACLAATAPAAADEPPHVIFNPKLFADLGDVVHVEGTVIGEHVGYKNNRLALTCYRQRRECLEVGLDSQGMQVFNIRPPHFFAIRVWAEDRITADSSAPCGDPPLPNIKKEDWAPSESQTWIVDRIRETAEEIDHQCLEAKTYHWTIEDPPYWSSGGKNAPEPPRQRSD